MPLPRQGDSVESVVWREVQRFRQDVMAVENALTCDAYRPEMDAAARALHRLSIESNQLGAMIRAAKALPEDSGS